MGVIISMEAKLLLKFSLTFNAFAGNIQFFQGI